MSSVQERLQLKRVPLDTWNIREKLFLASAVVRSGDQNWMSVSRALKTMGEPNRPPDWYSQKTCAAQYGALLEHVETPKRKKRNSEGAVETPQENILKRLMQQREHEIQENLKEMEKQYEQLKNEITELRNPLTPEDKIQQLWTDIETAKRARERENARRAAWLKEREERRARAERPWLPSQTPPPSSPTTAPPSSPLLTSLLKSSPVVTTPQHIPHPATVVDSVSPSAGAPTLSLLLEQPHAVESKHAAIEHIKSQLVQIEHQLKASSQSGVPTVEIDDIEIKAEDVYAFRDIDIHIPPVALHKSSVRVTDKPIFKKEEEIQPEPEVIDVVVQDIKVEPIIENPVEDEVFTSTDIEMTEQQKEKENEEEQKKQEQQGTQQEIQIETEIKIAFPEVKFPTPEIKVIQPDEQKIKEEVKEPEEPEEKIIEEKEDEKTAEESVEEPTITIQEKQKEQPQPINNREETTKPEPELLKLEKPELEKSESHLEPETKEQKEIQTDVAKPENIPLPEDNVEELIENEEIKEAQNPPPEENIEQKEQSISKEEIKEEKQEIKQEPVEDMKEVIEENEDSKKEDDAEDSIPLKEMIREELESVKREVVEEDTHTETDDDTPMELSREEEKDGKKKRDYSRKKKSDSRTCSGSESAPESPSGSDAERQHRLWRKSVMLVYSRLCAHKYASLFLRPITDEEAPGYSAVVRRPIDLTHIRRDIDAGHIRTTAQFQRAVLLMLSNALMYNSSSHSVYSMAKEMHEEAHGQLSMLVAAQAHAGLCAPRRKRRRYALD